MIKNEIKIFLTSVMFYTRIPCPSFIDHSEDYLNKATRYFPLIGIIVGSLSSALIFRTFHFEWFPSFKDFMNHMVGAVLMGVGGVLGMGCTIGQAVAGTSTMSFGSIIVFLSIVFGSAVTVKTRYYLIYYDDEANLPKAILSSLVDFRFLPKSFRRLDAV